jgi:epoxyqueuosine reductase
MILSARGDIAQLPLRELLELTPERFARVFRGTAIKRLKLAGLLRNACVAAGNSGDRSLINPLARLASHGSPVVRAHAVWAVVRLGGAECLASERLEEREPSVIGEYGGEPGLPTGSK